MTKLYKGTREVLRLAGGVKNVKTLYAGDKIVWGEEEQKTVHIGEYDYPFVKIGNLYWLAENLKEDWGTNVWFENNQSKYEPLKYGRLYRYDSVNTIQSLLPSDWRIPSRSDFENLFSIYPNWQDYVITDYGGTNLTGLNYNFSGCFYQSNFINKDIATNVLTTEYTSTTRTQAFIAHDGIGLYGEPNSANGYFSVRLCKNV